VFVVRVNGLCVRRGNKNVTKVEVEMLGHTAAGRNPVDIKVKRTRRSLVKQVLVDSGFFDRFAHCYLFRVKLARFTMPAKLKPQTKFAVKSKQDTLAFRIRDHGAPGEMSVRVGTVKRPGV
jgi:hypothetical protein